MIEKTNKIRNDVVNFGSSATALSINDKSIVISKIKPKIRIIHIIAPEIIKTDITNFRDLVQSLTGKSSIRNNNNIGKKKSLTSGSSPAAMTPASTSKSTVISNHNHHHHGMQQILKNEIIKDEIYQPWEGDVMINTDGIFGTGFFSDMDSLIINHHHHHHDLAGGFS
ncbi:VQ motif-containing protein 17-like [Impatiens glandulifera]|uniref:VQ motif-containing protein 17-like n=1 Tax=Impatiens glandulifera TaxID=253017 RepID=UPI001FB19341|nr:VQ motif-containing protein 17-like [Impatiens glandulifera]